jgi:hypothetical protein
MKRIPSIKRRRVRDLGDKVAQADRDKVEAKIAELKSAMNGEDIQKIRR